MLPWNGFLHGKIQLGKLKEPPGFGFPWVEDLWEVLPAEFRFETFFPNLGSRNGITGFF